MGWSLFWWLIYTKKYLNKPIRVILGRGVNFPFNHLLNRMQAAHYSTPSTDAPTMFCPCNGPFVGIRRWLVRQILAWNLPKASPHRQYLLDWPFVDYQSVVGSVNGHCPGSVIGSLGSFFWGILWGLLEVVHCIFQIYYTP